MRNPLPYGLPLFLFGYSVFSYSQTDPNLVLSSNPLFWQFQQQMWQLGYHNRPLATGIFVILCILLFGAYISLIGQIKSGKWNKQKLVGLFITSLVALLPAYPALSHDIFNYVFNAKMMLVYRANPHVQVALDFPQDPWLRFMHNTHTPAPYGYGWTFFSLLPYSIGQGYLQGELLSFRLTMILFFVVCLWLLTRIEHISYDKMALLAFNPLMLIEIVGNIHNDIVMMVAALGGGLLIRNGIRKRQWFNVFSGILCFSFSISIKFASIALIGAVFGSVVLPQLSLYQWSVLALWSPLLTKQSQWFLPWYLTWSFVLAPLIRNTFWVRTMIATTVAGLLSYGLILWYGEYSSSLLLQRSILLFGLPLVYLLGQLLLQKRVS